MGCRTLMCIWYKGKKRREKAKDENFPFAPTIYHHVPNWEKIDQLNRNANECLGGNSLKKFKSYKYFTCQTITKSIKFRITYFQLKLIFIFEKPKFTSDFFVYLTMSWPNGSN